MKRKKITSENFILISSENSLLLAHTQHIQRERIHMINESQYLTAYMCSLILRAFSNKNLTFAHFCRTSSANCAPLKFSLSFNAHNGRICCDTGKFHAYNNAQSAR